MPVVSVDAKSIPMVHTENVSMLISDSGVTRYRLEAKIWDMYSNLEDPYWYFPEKIYVEQFDSLFNVEGSIEADTAYYYEKKDLWRLIGNVFVKNLEGSTFETSELFWDRKAPPHSVEALYTDKFAKITQPNGNIQYGRKGFKSNQTLTDVRFYALGGEFNIEESGERTRPAGASEENIQ